MDPQQWLDNFEAKLADLQRKSADLQENFENSQATASSPDGAVTITVGPNGGLLNIQLGHRATELGSARLTALIMQTAKVAQKQAAQQVMAAFEPLGEGTEAMRMVSDAIPTDEVDDDDDRDDYAAPEAEPAPPAPTATHAPTPAPYSGQPQTPYGGQPQTPSRPARPSRPGDDEDDDNQPW
ncbi:YbaB/EbfC family nucleoid-associated protein [Saccharothrix sp. 6-C]|uniref:YbaB/EbfC family nucleoid-associated protein n=1 Tax=Saccharothrix sp. 6-C TaxID=2781735 RepID=UPI0019170130|nr:YbaB/EbfC family nucleoid-associated protein [Saccharothrix sp. 6-C]QQQ75802.1 YbaB/EbfC family nucleoid-associated protein [Saccharothrix sp. 6-C]